MQNVCLNNINLLEHSKRLFSLELLNLKYFTSNFKICNNQNRTNVLNFQLTYSNYVLNTELEDPIYVIY